MAKLAVTTNTVKALAGVSVAALIAVAVATYLYFQQPRKVVLHANDEGVITGISSVKALTTDNALLWSEIPPEADGSLTTGFSFLIRNGSAVVCSFHRHNEPTFCTESNQLKYFSEPNSFECVGSISPITGKLQELIKYSICVSKVDLPTLQGTTIPAGTLVYALCDFDPVNARCAPGEADASGSLRLSSPLTGASTPAIAPAAPISPQPGTASYNKAVADVKAEKCKLLQEKFNRAQFDLDTGNLFAARDMADISASAEMTGCHLTSKQASVAPSGNATNVQASSPTTQSTDSNVRDSNSATPADITAVRESERTLPDSIPTADQCSADAPAAQGAEESALVASGHRFLTGKRLRAGVRGEIIVVEAALGYDGQCRPDPYQIYIFNNGKQVGTLSPDAMHARSDGAITDFKLLDADHLQFKVDHYKPSDPACCASSHEEKVVSLSQLVSSQASNAQDNPHALVQSSQTTSQGIATLEQVSARMLWTQTDSGKEVNWVEANSFCSSQGAGWRLPSTNELDSIFDQSSIMTTSCGAFTCKVSPLFRLSAGGYWTNVEVGHSGAMVFVLDGGTTYQGRKDGRGNVRALCVKSTIVSDATAGGSVQVPMRTSTSPSFDCRKATTTTENAICASAELSGLDGQLGQLFSDVIATASPDQTKNARAEQVAWIKARNEECQGDPSCLGTSLRKRIAELTTIKGKHPSIPMAQEGPQNAIPTASHMPLAHVNNSPTNPNANSNSQSSECQSYAKDIARLRASGSAIDSHVADRLEFARSLQGCR